MGADHEGIGADRLEAVAGVETLGTVIVDEDREEDLLRARAAAPRPITQSISTRATPVPCQGFST